MRKLLGTLAGVATAVLTILLVEAIGAKLFTLPGSFETGETAPSTMVSAMPLGAKLVVTIGWFLGGFAGAYSAFRLAKWDAAGWIIAMLVAAGGVANIVSIPHPLWMQVSAVSLPFIGALFAFGLYRRWQR
jgi:hypothetical protein